MLDLQHPIAVSKPCFPPPTDQILLKFFRPPFFFFSLPEIGLELQGCVDKGSCAAVFKAVSLGSATACAEDEHTWQGEKGTVFAVKILLTSMTNEDFVKNFRREALLLGRVNHPGIIRMYHHGKTPAPFIVTEWCDGGNVWNAVKCEEIKARHWVGDEGDEEDESKRIKINTPTDAPLLDIPAVGMDVALALEYLHNAGFAHRDMKSHNVLLTWCPTLKRVRYVKRRDAFEKIIVRRKRIRHRTRLFLHSPPLPFTNQNRAKLCDLGSAAPISKMPRRPAKNWLGFSGRWQPVGTMLWMAPEMLEPPLEGATAPVGYSGDKVDVYSLGIVLWELMEFKIPWTHGDISKQLVIDSVVVKNERLPIPKSCDARLAELLVAMWATSPVDRPDMAYVVTAFREIGAEWDDAGMFARVAKKANLHGEQLAKILTQVNSEQENPLDDDSGTADVGDVTVTEETSAEQKHVTAKEDASTEVGVESTNGNGKKTREKKSDENRENWFGDVGSVDFEQLSTKLIPMLYPHMFASATAAADRQRLDEQRTELVELESKAVELKARSKLDPFAAFTADAKAREAKRLDKTISLAAAESEVHAWRATRDLLREQLAEADRQHLEWRRKYREIDRKR